MNEWMIPMAVSVLLGALQNIDVAPKFERAFFKLFIVIAKHWYGDQGFRDYLNDNGVDVEVR